LYIYLFIDEKNELIEENIEINLQNDDVNKSENIEIDIQNSNINTIEYNRTNP
jgi:hypothetical protein